MREVLEMSQGTPNPFALVLAVGVEVLIAIMDTVTAGTNRIIRWLEKP